MELVKKITNSIVFEIAKILLLVISILYLIPKIESFEGKDLINSFIIDNSIYGPIFYILIKIISIVCIMLPIEIISIPVNRAIGFDYALLLSTISLIIGGSINYTLSRNHGIKFIKTIIGTNTADMVKKYATQLSNQNQLGIAVFFFGVSYKYASHVIGLTKKTYIEYLIGLFPGGLFISGMAIMRDIYLYNNNFLAVIFTVIPGIVNILALYHLFGFEIFRKTKKLLLKIKKNLN